MTLFMTGSPAAGQASGRSIYPSTSDCYAFNLQGDLWTRCGAKALQVTTLGDMGGFAVLPDGSGLAVDAGENSDIVSVSLLRGSIRREIIPFSRSTFGLFPSCGTALMGFLHGPGDREILFQGAFTRQFISKPPYTEFVCSSNGQQVIGFLDRDYTVLRIGFPPRDLYRATGQLRFIDDFAISPDGKYVAFWFGESLCVQETAGGRQCVDFGGTISRMSVSNRGEVLLGQTYENLGDGICWWKDHWHVSLHRRPGYNNAGGCPSVEYWRPGLKKPQVLEPLGDLPQWLTPEAAKQLVSLGKHLAQQKR